MGPLEFVIEFEKAAEVRAAEILAELEKTAISPTTAGSALGKRTSKMLQALGNKTTVPVDETLLDVPLKATKGVYTDYARRLGTMGSESGMTAMNRGIAQELGRGQFGKELTEKELQSLMGNVSTKPLEKAYTAGGKPHVIRESQQVADKTKEMARQYRAEHPQSLGGMLKQRLGLA